MDFLKVPKVFFIKGVFKHTAKSLADIIQEQVAEEKAEQKTSLLKIYKSDKDDEWLEQKPVKCSSCYRSIPGRHIFVPQIIETIKGVSQYTCCDTARFCSWWCAARHIRFFLKNDDRYKLLLNRLYSLWEHKPVIELEPALPPWLIDELGGDLTIDQYHKLCELNFNKFQSSFLSKEDHESLTSED